MSDDLLLTQYERLLDGLPAAPWPALAESGFLDLLRGESDGGAGFTLEALFPLALASGRRPTSPPVIETMLARLVDAEASDVADAEAALRGGGLAPGQARALAAIAAAGQMAGAMDAVQEMTLAYASTRQQFGREISKFQAIQHQIAVMAEEAQAARMAAQAAFVGAPDAASEMKAAAAKARCGRAAVSVAAIAHAVHGAIGMSEEYPLHNFTRRLHGWRMAHGGDAYWSRRLGQWALEQSDSFGTLARAL
jgi:alkylation response protein AidB-like acyl-CoA dehydrogenase